MNQAISLALLAGGVLLLIFGLNESQSFSSDVSRFFTGSPTDRSMWMIVGGAILTVAGLVGFLRGAKTK
jgi:hypothetical protein